MQVSSIKYRTQYSSIVRYQQNDGIDRALTETTSPDVLVASPVVDARLAVAVSAGEDDGR